MEVFLQRLLPERGRFSFLHIRGGVSALGRLITSDGRFSPHTWRCFLLRNDQPNPVQVFSTYVEVFPSPLWTLLSQTCFLHIRGGVSCYIAKRCILYKFSPHTWRCFQDAQGAADEAEVFSTYVEVFPICRLRTLNRLSFLHIRGGVSVVPVVLPVVSRFSPHTWRCFLQMLINPNQLEVFSTYVEVFPQQKLLLRDESGFLHIRGGVSEWFRDENLIDSFSPHTWRCFSKPKIIAW